VITDSISVHALWTRGLTDRFFVTDPLTGEALVVAGVEPGRVSASGFPVSHETPAGGVVAGAAAVAAGGTRSAWRVLFFPTQSRKTVCGQLRELAERVGRDGRLTVVLGRHDRRLRPAVESEIERLLHPGVTLHGWVPEAWRLMGQHDVVVGKAGGATVHEARACRVPILIDKVVPGQEEGNADLVRMSGTGWVVPRGGSFAETLSAALTDAAVDAARRALGELPDTNAALEIARALIAPPTRTA
jgi:processive 1,2-diacylglycerol beta-glucosyltransferase